MTRLPLCLLLALAPLAVADDFKPEEGFKPLLGKSLDGWKEKKGGASLDGRTEAYKGRFKLADGVLTIDPKVKGDVRIETATAPKGDLHIKFEFRPGKGCNNDLFLRGQKFDINPTGKEGKTIKLDEWNTFDIVIKGTDVEFRINGETARRGKTKSAASPFEIRAEFGPMDLRRLRIKEGG